MYLSTPFHRSEFRTIIPSMIHSLVLPPLPNGAQHIVSNSCPRTPSPISGLHDLLVGYPILRSSKTGPVKVRSLGKSVRENMRHPAKRFHEHFCLGTLRYSIYQYMVTRTVGFRIMRLLVGFSLSSSDAINLFCSSVRYRYCTR